MTFEENPRISQRSMAINGEELSSEPLLPIENQVLEKGILGVRLELSNSQVHDLLASGYYRKSIGNPADAQHYRRSLEDRTCLHLVVDGESIQIHCDQFDPHRDPHSLAFHLIFDARRETLSTIATAWALLRMLAR